MANRLAFSVPKSDIEIFFNLETTKETIFEPHYNLAPGQQLPTVYIDKKEQAPAITQIRWAAQPGKSPVKTSFFKDDVPGLLKTEDITPCILPLSGYYMWRDNDEKGQPFFVRMLNHSIMAVAGLIFNGKNPFVSIITTESNTLIQPMSKTMPFVLNSKRSQQWMQNPEDSKEFLNQASNLFLLTDYSVLKVNKKVNDLGNNSEKLIQPIPK